MLEKLWDDVMAGPQPETGLDKLRKTLSVQTSVEAGEGSSSKYQRSMTMPASPTTPTTPSTPSPTARKENVWRSVFHPGSNLATKRIGAAVFDKPIHPNSPTVYDWMYSGETRSKHR
ncbi:PREDICTED: dormancy-associated protein 1 isoform X2 [Ipomoea nil]|uniref:dormancy-associated protein 1 isoform X2 n=1 Tax=Ipomoea nil TaxID=35883 RepID=UPI000900A39F|nr:PREDICTED: dormancy-associated protein 1 isoform X2 [Ipomoea nil]